MLWPARPCLRVLRGHGDRLGRGGLVLFRCYETPDRRYPRDTYRRVRILQIAAGRDAEVADGQDQGGPLVRPGRPGQLLRVRGATPPQAPIVRAAAAWTCGDGSDNAAVAVASNAGTICRQPSTART